MRDPGLVARLERQFADFHGALKAGDLTAAEANRSAIEQAMPRVIELTEPTTSPWGSFLESFVIILREGFEAILVIGAVVAFLIKTGHRQRVRDIWLGSAAGLGASLVLAFLLRTVLAAVPASGEIIEGATLLVAVVVLFSVSYWLLSKVESARWQQFIREQVSAALSKGGSAALGFVAFLAVFREGAETALFFQALLAKQTGSGAPIFAGIAAGGATLAVIFSLFHRFGVRIPLRPFFAVTSGLLYWMAFVFAGKGIKELQEGHAVSRTVLPGFPTVEAFGMYPTVETIIAQGVLVALLLFAQPLVAVLYHYGAFQERDVGQTTAALMGYGVGLVGLVAIKVLAPGFYANQDTRTPVKIAVAVLVLTQLLNLVLVLWLLVLSAPLADQNQANADDTANYQ